MRIAFAPPGCSVKNEVTSYTLLSKINQASFYREYVNIQPRLRIDRQTLLLCLAISSRENVLRLLLPFLASASSSTGGIIQPPSSFPGATGCWNWTTGRKVFSSWSIRGRTRYQALLGYGHQWYPLTRLTRNALHHALDAGITGERTAEPAGDIIRTMRFLFEAHSRSTFMSSIQGGTDVPADVLRLVVLPAILSAHYDLVCTDQLL